MKHAKISLTLLTVLIASTFAIANEGSHPGHLWTEDARAYRSYTGENRAAYASKKNLARLSARDLEFVANDYLVASLKTLSGVNDPILANRGKSAGRDAARVFLRREFESFGFSVREEKFRTGTNLVAEKAGASGKFLIVSAHYDSVNNAGADDDATGVVAMLGTAKMLQSKKLKHGVRFVAFDQEEVGLVGSAAYVADLVRRGEAPTVLGDLQMEMMGFNKRNDGKFHVISCKRADSQFMVDAFVEAVRNLPSKLVITEACTDRSDHASFWKHEIPAIVISENFFGGDSNPCYHRSCDTVDRMHLPYFVKVAEAAANAVMLIAAQ
jgi:hypothetical protein